MDTSVELVKANKNVDQNGLMVKVMSTDQKGILFPHTIEKTPVALCRICKYLVLDEP